MMLIARGHVLFSDTLVKNVVTLRGDLHRVIR